jgi:uncharacterized protein
MKTLKIVKQTATLSFIGSTVMLTSLPSQALTVEEVTNPRHNNGGWVSDTADILSDRTEAKLNRLISNLEQTNGTEIAVVTVPETTPAESPKTFATQLFNYWGIGKAEADNGVLLLVSKSDRRVEIETGYGIEAILPDDRVGNIIDTKITPQYKQGNYDRGTLDGTEAIVEAIGGSVLNESKSVNWQLRLLEIMFFLMAVGGQMIIVGVIRWFYPSSSSSDSSSSSYGGSSSSSGSDFGGGSSGGGGDGGSW